jgi:hypothetical protein
MKPKRKRVIQMYLPQPGPPLPAWSSLPEKCRNEILMLLVEILRSRAQRRADATGGRDE